MKNSIYFDYASTTPVDPRVAKKMFATLADNSINILAISTSEIKISVLIDKKFTKIAVKSLHEAYNLGK